MKRGWQKYLLYASIVIVGGVILFETIRLKNTGFEGKSLWEWMELLIIPAVLAGGAFYLNRSERSVERQIAEDRAKLEREIATDRQQEAALQSYFDRMSELLLKEKLRTTKKAEVRDVARTRTLSIMRVLDTKRINLIIQFLREAKLITSEKSILNDANMKGMVLNDLNLSAVYLQGANLERAKLMYVDMNEANLSDADLTDADLRKSSLIHADLSGANLQDTDLERAIFANANMQDALLGGANLQGADLSGADLSGTNLSRANLSGVNLSGANLQGAKNLTQEQLKKVKTLQGATMSKGIKYE